MQTETERDKERETEQETGGEEETLTEILKLRGERYM